jgi:hypothetical protein
MRKNQPNKKRYPLGVIIFGTALILSSLDQFRHIPAFDNYKQINQGMPDALLMLRYSTSFLLRAAGLASGIGILFLNDRFRKFLIGLSTFSILTVFLRHTYSAQLYYSEPLYRQHGSMFSLETFTWIAVLIRWAIEIIFSSAVIFYFTRPKIAQRFK